MQEQPLCRCPKKCVGHLTTLELEDSMNFSETNEVFKIKTSPSSNGPSIKMSLEMLFHIFFIEHVGSAKVSFHTHGVDQEGWSLKEARMCLG